MSKLLTIAEVAERVRKTEGAARWWLSQKDCPVKAAKIGGRIFVREDQLEQYIESAFEATASV